MDFFKSAFFEDPDLSQNDNALKPNLDPNPNPDTPPRFRVSTD